MNDIVHVTIQNRLVTEERDITVFHHSTSSSYIVSYDSAITVPLETASRKDYLHIAVPGGPGDLWMDCVIDQPWWANFEMSCQGKLSVSHSIEKKRTRITIPPGPPKWQIKISVPDGLSKDLPVTADNIVVGDQAEGDSD